MTFTVSLLYKIRIRNKPISNTWSEFNIRNSKTLGLLKTPRRLTYLARAHPPPPNQHFDTRGPGFRDFSRRYLSVFVLRTLHHRVRLTNGSSHRCFDRRNMNAHFAFTVISRGCNTTRITNPVSSRPALNLLYSTEIGKIPRLEWFLLILRKKSVYGRETSRHRVPGPPSLVTPRHYNAHRANFPVRSRLPVRRTSPDSVMFGFGRERGRESLTYGERVAPTLRSTPHNNRGALSTVVFARLGRRFRPSFVRRTEKRGFSDVTDVRFAHSPPLLIAHAPRLALPIVVVVVGTTSRRRRSH